MNDILGQSEHTSIPVPGSWADRNGFAHWALAIIWMIIGFILFQVVASIVAVVLFTFFEGIPDNADVLQLLMERLDLVFIGNSTGQILFLGLATFLIVRLHTSAENRKNFLRLRIKPGTVRMAAGSALLFVVVQPTVWYIGYLNSLIPVPEQFSLLEDTQYEMIENFLRSDGVLAMALFHVALIPAVCEEIMFRGYVFRAFEKSWGAWTAILVSGFLFGLYHLQLTNLLPLATLGILLALVTWLSGSLIPAIVAHFVNNGGAVVMVSFYPDLAFADVSPESAPPLWIVLLSILFTAGLIRFLFQQSETEG